MTDSKEIQEFKRFITIFDKARRSREGKTLKSLVLLIKQNEELFLNKYKKRKKEGVFYTDEDLAKFIVSKALLKKLNKNLDLKEFNFKSIKDIMQNKAINKNSRDLIIHSLLQTTICDPTCGAGVFLLAAADILFNLIKVLNPELDNYNLKRSILKNLYGLDINEQTTKLTILKLLAWIIEGNSFNIDIIISTLEKNFKVYNSLFTPNWVKHLYNKNYFDIICGNPPYGNILSINEKRILKQQGIFYNDVYCAFLSRAIDWIDAGVIAFLVPKSFLLRQGYIQFRKDFLNKVNILEIYDMGSKIFKQATNEVQIIIYEKKTEENITLEIIDFPNKPIIAYENQSFDNLRICLNKDCPYLSSAKKIYVYTFNNQCPYCKSETNQIYRIRIKATQNIHTLLSKIERRGNLNYLNIKDFPKMIRGEEDNGLKLIREALKTTKGDCYYISAKDDFQYYYINKGKSFQIEEINSKELKGKNYEYYLSKKLLIKHNNIIPEAMYSENKVCFTSSIYSLLHEDIDELKYICAVLNSTLIQFYCIYGINNQKDTTINLNQYMIRHLPIVKPDEKIKSEIVQCVDAIISSYQDSNGKITSKISTLTKQIDLFIFKLFNLSRSEQELIIERVVEKINYFQKIYSI
ncbi:MAG: Eco57I restriction-modification methylase domain-containing protein [Promethearchaeota archaeon]